MSDCILKVEDLNISVGSGNSVRSLVKNGNIVVNKGEVVLLLGENGSGKSSIFKALVGDLNNSLTSKIKMFFNKQANCSNVNVNLFFKDMNSPLKTLEDFRVSIGYARQEDDLDNFFLRNGEEYILDYASHSKYFIGKSKQEIFEKYKEVCEKMKCVLYNGKPLSSLKLNKCSGGERRIISLLCALCRTESDLFILDEPINNLDAEHARLFNDYIIDLKKSENRPGVLIITHCRMIQKPDRVYVLKDGHIYDEDKDYDLLKQIDPSYEKYKAQCCFGKCDSCTGKYYNGEV